MAKLLVCPPSCCKPRRETPEKTEVGHLYPWYQRVFDSTGRGLVPDDCRMHANVVGRVTGCTRLNEWVCRASPGWTRWLAVPGRSWRRRPFSLGPRQKTRAARFMPKRASSRGLRHLRPGPTARARTAAGNDDILSDAASLDRVQQTHPLPCCAAARSVSGKSERLRARY